MFEGGLFVLIGLKGFLLYMWRHSHQPIVGLRQWTTAPPHTYNSTSIRDRRGCVSEKGVVISAKTARANQRPPRSSSSEPITSEAIKRKRQEKQKKTSGRGGPEIAIVVVKELRLRGKVWGVFGVHTRAAGIRDGCSIDRREGRMCRECDAKAPPQCAPTPPRPTVSSTPLARARPPSNSETPPRISLERLKNSHGD